MNATTRIGVETDGEVTVVRLNDRKLQEMVLIGELHDELLEFVEQHPPDKLLIDFASVTQCSSAVVNSMLMVRKRLHGRGAAVRLCGMQKQVRQTFQLLKLDGTLFQIHETVPDGLAAFGGG